MNPNDKKNGTKDQTPIVTIAAGACHQGETAARNTVQQPAKQPHTKSGKSSGKAANGDGEVTLATGRSNQGHFYLPSGYARQCDICGREYLAKRDTSKFCGGRCRQQAWLRNHPEVASAKNAAYREQLKARIEARGGRWIEQ